jgi:hypothetical protein
MFYADGIHPDNLLANTWLKKNHRPNPVKLLELMIVVAPQSTRALPSSTERVPVQIANKHTGIFINQNQVEVEVILYFDGSCSVVPFFDILFLFQGHWRILVNDYLCCHLFPSL